MLMIVVVVVVVVVIVIIVVVGVGGGVGDNMWLWRADHADGGAVTYDSNRCNNGLLVSGDNVIMYVFLFAINHSYFIVVRENLYFNNTHFSKKN